MKEAFLPSLGPTPLSSSLSMAVALGALSMEEVGKIAEQGEMERPENELMYNRGCGAAQFARYEEAASVFSELLAREPENRPARYNRGLAWLHLRCYAEARADFDAVIANEKGNAKAWCNLAHLLLATNEISRAREAALHALALDPGARPAAINLGHALIYNLYRADAEAAYRRALSNDASGFEFDRVMDAVRHDVSEFRDAGWPADKLKELTTLIRRVQLDPFGRKEKLPAADGSDGFLGANLETLRARSEFFNLFHLEPVGEGKLHEERVTTDFKPSGSAFRDDVTLRVVADRDGFIESVRLEIARKFIDDPEQGIFACDLAKSFLRSAAAPADRAELNEIAAEIEANARTTRPLLSSGKRHPTDTSPDQLRQANRVFFGFWQRWDARLKSRRLAVSHDSGKQKVWIEMLC